LQENRANNRDINKVARFILDEQKTNENIAGPAEFCCLPLLNLTVMMEKGKLNQF
jgi:hypothetical protein